MPRGIFALLGLVISAAGDRVCPSTPQQQHLFFNASNVTRVEWGRYEFSDEGGPTSRREPFVVTGSPGEPWRHSLGNWSGKAVLPTARRNQKTALFILTNRTEPMDEIVGMEVSEVLQQVPLESMFHKQTKGRMYAAAPLAQLHPSISNALGPRDFMEAEEVTLEEQEGQATLSEAVLWVAQEGSIAQLHYDKAHNMFMVLRGAKTFWLLPPSAWGDIPLFPSFHPLARHARKDVMGALPETLDEPRGAPIPGALRADLQPGEVLYVPPFWLHSVSTTQDTVALSVLSPSFEEQLAAAIRWTKLPLTNLTSTALRAAAAHTILHPMLPLGRTAVIWKSRHDRGWPDSGAVPVGCFADGAEWEAAKRQVEGRSSLFQNATKELQKALNGMTVGSSAQHVKAMMLADYVESLSAWAVGLSNVAHFIQRCF